MTKNLQALLKDAEATLLAVLKDPNCDTELNATETLQIAACRRLLGFILDDVAQGNR